MTFGAFISAKRKELRLTLRETAKHLGIACGYLSDVEQSRRPISVMLSRAVVPHQKVIL